jgi:predicted DNA-binding ribbon-helix-helix protein
MRTSALVSRNVVTADGRRTSVRLEPELFAALERIATARQITVRQLVAEIDAARHDLKLTNALRVYIVQELSRRAGMFGDGG